MGLKLNPIIANFFTQLGIVEELGNGTRTMFKYVPMISGGSDPIIKEEDEFSVNIPYLSQETDNKPTTNQQETDNKPTTSRQETDNKPITNQAQRIVLSLLEEGEKSIVELMDACGYKDRDSFRKSVLNEMIINGLIAMTHPENPNHRNQRYKSIR